jgi:hypothetical protein
MDAHGAISITGERRYFEWQNNAHELLRPVQKPSRDLKRLERKADAYSRMVRAFTLMQMQAASSDQ